MTILQVIRRRLRRVFVYGAALSFGVILDSAADRTSVRPPNIILINADNLGYGDLGVYGSKLHRTPRIDTMAREGIRFTDFYAASPVCTASRAALLTGSYPHRNSMHEFDWDGSVLRPVSPYGLHPDEVTLAELLREQGYYTAGLGKWHPHVLKQSRKRLVEMFQTPRSTVAGRPANLETPFRQVG